MTLLNKKLRLVESFLYSSYNQHYTESLQSVRIALASATMLAMTTKKKDKFLLVDAHALIHRAFHALPPLTNKAGEPVGAVYGFLLILIRAIKDIKPKYVVVTFDSKGDTFRHKIFKEYKANREAPADELVSQFPIVREVVKAFGYPVFAEPGYEADDLIGTVCEQMEDNDDVETIIVTGDMDLLQLVDANTKVLKLRRGIKDTLIYDEAMVKEKHGFTPEQVIDYKGLRGDSSDNIPGVKGIGEKSATTLLQEYKNIEEIYDNLENITGRSLKALDGHKDDAILSRELATIAKDAPIKFSLEDAKVGTYNNSAIIKLFQKYEFKTLLAQVKDLPGFTVQEGLFAPKHSSDEAGSTDHASAVKRDGFDYHLVQSDAEIKDLAAKLSKQKIFAFDTETTGLNTISDDLVGMSFSWKKGEGYYLAYGKKVPTPIIKVMEDPKIEKTCHNAKFDIKVMNTAGVKTQGVTFDTMIASYILNSGSRGHGLDNQVFIEFGHQMQPITDLIGKKGKNQITMADVDVEKASWYASEDADFSWRLYKTFSKRLKDQGFEKIMDDIDIPSMHVLVDMEETGVKLDAEFLNSMSKKMHRRIKTLEKKIHDIAGEEFNVASPTQLKVILFDTLGLPTDKIKKTKTGYSTAASELDKLRGSHPIIEMIEEFRELSKLTSTYIDALPRLVNPKTGRIHTTFSQTITATGRLSSFDPNLQNIPIRTELGKEVRKAFIPEKGNVILSIDYSQVELRIVSHLAKDKVMKESFMRGEDIHARTAAELNDVELADVTSDMRRQAKAINFGVLYGMGVQGVMRDSGLSRDEAQTFLDKYFSVHAGIKKYIEDKKAFAHEHEYAETVFGRRRPLPDIKSGNRMISAGAERAAINMPVQGTAADIMKLAMIEVQNAIDSGDIKAQMILQVHDELVFEVKKSAAADEAAKIKTIMEKIYDLGVPFLVDVEAGPNWGDLKPLD